MDHSTITGRQGFFLLFLFFLGNLVTATGAKGMQGGWLLFLLLAGLSLPVLGLYFKAVGRRSTGRVFTEALGRYAGGILTLLYCALAVLLTGDAIRLFADFIVINDLNDAGAMGNAALLTVTVTLLLYSNLRSLGKAAWAIQPLTVALLLLSVCLTVGKMEPSRLLPLFAEDCETLVKGGLSSLGAVLTPVLFPIMVLDGAAPGNWSKQAYAAGVFACLLMAVLVLRDVMVLGYPAVSMFRFPGFTAAGVLRHSEILISAAFVLSQPFRAALCLRYVQECLTFWKPRWKSWYPPLLIALAALNGTFSWSSQPEQWHTGAEIAVILLLLAGPLAVIAAEKARSNRAKA